MWGIRGNRGSVPKFHRCFLVCCLWKKLWTVCITSCISRGKPCGNGDAQPGKSNFLYGYPVSGRKIRKLPLQMKLPNRFGIAQFCPGINPA